MLKTIKLLTAGMVFTTLLSCNGGNKSGDEASMSKNDTTMATNDTTKANNEVTIFKATLKGSDEVPANPSTATGTSTLTYNPATKTFTDVTSYSGITPSMGHIHKGAVGENGPVVFPFTNLASPITFNSDPLTDEQVNALFKDSMYVNLHTTKYPGGEIRGQLMKQ
ncbi:MAG TPA: CHRD domain-containing protein [Hanamia sp.]|nr:CHRD domain-containing protein [Hanamia sp.]